MQCSWEFCWFVMHICSSKKMYLFRKSEVAWIGIFTFSTCSTIHYTNSAKTQLLCIIVHHFVNIIQLILSKYFLYTTGSCERSFAISSVYKDKNYVKFGNKIGGISNPMVYQFDTWKASILVLFYFCYILETEKQKLILNECLIDNYLLWDDGIENTPKH